eukprot:TRINITY_DN30026_c0_g1_i1.p1 TRINITY_DN30026_c0_g1~~TRINITY_DN30026_c0_g1_i1.p1  ORF type:complete len:360 (+),score=66.39 TRINITY_DN30026_c0_g1_i1:33-1082(+)
MFPMKTGAALAFACLAAPVAGLALQTELPTSGTATLDLLQLPMTVSGISHLAEADAVEPTMQQTGNLRASLALHQQVLEQISSEQAVLAQEQARLTAKEDALLRTLGPQSSSAEEPTPLPKSSSSAAGREAEHAIRRLIGRRNAKEFQEALIASAVWLIALLVGGWVYGTSFTYAYPPVRLFPPVTRTGFTFPMWHGFTCDPDWRICFFACCLAPVRWADTASSPKIDGGFKFMGYWSFLFLFGVLYTMGHTYYLVSSVLLVAVAVWNRQRIRKAYGMPSGDCGTCCEDTCMWCCCHPCATMQEALEIEFVEPVGKPLQASMMERLSSNGFAADETLNTPRRKGQEGCC